MNRSDPFRQTTPSTDAARRDAWEELLLRGALQPSGATEPSPEDRWQRLSRRVAAHERVRSVHETVELRGAEFRRILALSYPWPSLFALFT